MNNESFYLVVGIVGAMFGIITLAYDTAVLEIVM